MWPALIFLKPKTHYQDGNKKNKRIKGSAIIISNHRAFWDAFAIALKFFFKRLHYLIIDFYTERQNFLRLVLRIAGGIFVDRNGFDLDFLEKCKQVTAKGRSVLVFPEGDFKFTYQPAKFSAGYLMMAIKTGSKIVPIANDFNYGLFKRVNLMIGNSIDLSEYTFEQMSKEQFKQLNDKISKDFLMLFFKLKQIKAKKFSQNYDFISPQKGDIIRVYASNYYHYGVYLSDDEVIQFGHAFNRPNQEIIVNSVSLNTFCADKIFEVRVFKKRESKRKRTLFDIEKYAKSCLGQGDYSLADNNCFDFANRIVLNI